MSYSGTVASEHSSGDRIRSGGITKTGNAHLRRIVIEAAWRTGTARPGGGRSSSASNPSVRRVKRSPGRRDTGCTRAIAR